MEPTAPNTDGGDGSGPRRRWSTLARRGWGRRRRAAGRGRRSTGSLWGRLRTAVARVARRGRSARLVDPPSSDRGSAGADDGPSSSDRNAAAPVPVLTSVVYLPLRDGEATSAPGVRSAVADDERPAGAAERSSSTEPVPITEPGPAAPAEDELLDASPGAGSLPGPTDARSDPTPTAEISPDATAGRPQPDPAGALGAPEAGPTSSVQDVMPAVVEAEPTVGQDAGADVVEPATPPEDADAVSVPEVRDPAAVDVVGADDDPRPSRQRDEWDGDSAPEGESAEPVEVGAAGGDAGLSQRRGGFDEDHEDETASIGQPALMAVALGIDIAVDEAADDGAVDQEAVDREGGIGEDDGTAGSDGVGGAAPESEMVEDPTVAGGDDEVVAPGRVAAASVEDQAPEDRLVTDQVPDGQDETETGPGDEEVAGMEMATTGLDLTDGVVEAPTIEQRRVDGLPTMADLDWLSAQLDEIDATLARMDAAPAPSAGSSPDPATDGTTSGDRHPGGG